MNIFDSENQLPLSGATILVLSDSSYCSSNQSGIAELRTDKLPSQIRISYIGFETIIFDMHKEDPAKTVFLKPKEFITGDVLVVGDKIHQSRNVMELSAARLHNSFSLGAERDPIKALADYSQFSQPNELSGGLFVRGSNPDQSIIILDGIPLWNPYHAMGFLSVIQGDVLSSMNVYIGTQPGYSPNRLGSTIEVETLKPVSKEWKSAVGIGILSSQFLSYGSVNDQSGLMIGFRRTYADLILDNLYSKSLTLPVMSFGDLVLSGYYDTEDFGKFSTTLFYSSDQFKFKNQDTTQTSDFLKIAYNYSSVGQSLRNQYTLNSKTDFKTTIYYSVGKNDFNGPLEQNKSLLSNFGLIFSIRNDVNPNISSELGFLTNSFNQAENFYGSSQQSYYQELRFWSKLNVNITDKFSLEQLFKLSSFSNNLNRFHYSSFNPNKEFVSHNFQPLFTGFISGSYLINNQIKLETSFSTNVQTEQLFSSNLSQLPTDHWVIAITENDVAKSTEFTVGLNYKLFNLPFDFSVIYFNKNIYKLISPYEEFPSGYILTSDYIDYGKGKSTGIELDAKYNGEFYTINFSYKYSNTVTSFYFINNNEEIFPISYQPHEFFLKADYQFSDHLNFTGTLTYKTGQYYPYVLYSIFQSINGRNPNFYVYNRFRYSDYFRIDLGMNYKFSLFTNKRNAEFLLQLYNLTFHRNVNFIEEAVDLKDNEDSYLKRRSYAYLPFFPSFGLRIEL